MPRAIVAPGSRSKRSCSSASSWRGANFSCCATSVISSPHACRARSSSSPTPVTDDSVKAAPLQRLVLRGAGEAPAQLVGVRLLVNALAELALDAQREPQRLGAGRDQLVVLRHELARLVEAALPVADLAEAQQRDRLFWIQAQRALEELLGVLEIVGAQRADAGRRVGFPRRRVQRVADGLQEIGDRLAFALRLAQEHAVVVVDVRVVRRQAQRALEARLGELVLAQVHVHQAEHALRRRIARVGGGGDAQLLERDAHVAAAVILGRELGVDLGAVARLADLADDGAGVDARLARLAGAAGERQEHKVKQPFHARTSFRGMRRALRRVRSATSPASWPQVAAMPSPRVLRVVTVRPARCRISAKRRIRSGLERRNPECRKGLNRIRLNLQRTWRATPASSRACASASFTPSSMTYSRVMKSRGAFSR